MVGITAEDTRMSRSSSVAESQEYCISNNWLRQSTISSRQSRKVFQDCCGLLKSFKGLAVRNKSWRLKLHGSDVSYWHQFFYIYFHIAHCFYRLLFSYNISKNFLLWHVHIYNVLLQLASRYCPTLSCYTICINYISNLFCYYFALILLVLVKFQLQAYVVQQTKVAPYLQVLNAYNLHVVLSYLCSLASGIPGRAR